MTNIIFITGIDTDIGKTIATGWLAREWHARGERVITQKLIQTGTPENTIAADILAHRRIQGITPTAEDRARLTAPCVYSYPCSPHLAAKMDNRPLDLDAIDRASETLSARYDWVLLEGAGGICVPLTEELTTLEFIQARNYPVVIVTSGRLGSINHTLLTLQACAQAGLAVHSLIFNEFGAPDKKISADSRKYLQNYLQKNHPEAAFLILPILEKN